MILEVIVHHNFAFRRSGGHYHSDFVLQMFLFEDGPLGSSAYSASTRIDIDWNEDATQCTTACGYLKAGTMLDDLLRKDERPRTLFEENTARRDRLMGALDAINGRSGTWTAVTASQGFKREWKMRSEIRSPAWTTDITEVPRVRAG